ncbi:aldo/keto reductase [Aerococcaceae bacterium zg-BR22]|uniref:aldo/keto reductase n=1 Tax=Aerococcaceae bacterium zg-1292 TaxID=2774330 RepID=UPI0040633D5D|nr:aldo/keto reductase [Aerococcaceae bacterium zg-BR22]
MKYKRLGNTDLYISELSFGTWALGGSWGEVATDEAIRAINVAIDEGVNFFDTADVYGIGKSETILGQVLKTRSEEVFVATKFGRRDDFSDLSNYSYERVRQYCEDSLKNLQKEAIDLYQIHCPSFEVIKEGSIFGVLERLKQEGKIRYYGVSVETDNQGEYIIQHTDASSIQVIFNVLRQQPLHRTIKSAKEREIGIIARVPLASGLLSGKYNINSVFREDDHRHYNRDGQSFNVGETFGGLPFDKAIELVSEVSWIAEGREDLAQAALKWIMQQPGVTTVIPGFKTVEQVRDNLSSQFVAPFSEKELLTLEQFYQEKVHSFIRGNY